MPPHGPLEPACGTYMCMRVVNVEELYSCIKRVENSLRTGLGLFTDLGQFPEASDSVRPPAM